MSAPLDQDLYVMAEARRPSVISESKQKAALYVAKECDTASASEVGRTTADGEEPTMEEMKTLRRVSGKIPWTAWTITFVEFCEYVASMKLFSSYDMR